MQKFGGRLASCCCWNDLEDPFTERETHLRRGRPKVSARLWCKAGWYYIPLMILHLFLQLLSVPSIDIPIGHCNYIFRLFKSTFDLTWTRDDWNKSWVCEPINHSIDVIAGFFLSILKKKLRLKNSLFFKNSAIFLKNSPKFCQKLNVPELFI